MNSPQEQSYKLISLIGLWLSVLSFGCSAGGKAPATEEARPNIILILADDLGYGDIGSYGQKLISTPHLDRMAQQGIRFTQHYAGSAVCAPSRSVLMTGQHTGHTPIRGNGSGKDYPMADSVLTLAELLKSAGYRTAMIGKWGLGMEGTSGEPNRQGFDLYYGYLNQILAHNYYPEYLLRNGKREPLNNEVHYRDSSGWHKGLGSYSTKQVDYSHDLFTTEALRFIADGQAAPFFLYLPYTIPHNNGEAPEGEKWEVPDFGEYADKPWTPTQKAYAAMITRLDRDVGRIVDQVRKAGQEDNTLIIFTSDNGPETAEFFTMFDSNGPLRGGKRDLYEGGIRVPFIAYWPGTITAGQVTDQVSASWDLFPTLGDVAGVSSMPPRDGISLLPTLIGEEEPLQHDYLYWEFAEMDGRVAIRQGDWKAVKYNYFAQPDASFELYDLSNDLGESKNVAAEHPEVVEQMEAIVTKARTPSADFPLTQSERMTSDTQK
ncbi:arylsulfatase [Tunicatimonas pelagia]|uniref:arylsulfatase n=1 Tax=Tunicatimonas pelagia TaxID=931531 RepID=UPI00266635EF|nr:arylsulfatase [Tunicatimonas pelagia]WKN45468.1 arylsulfatase [Tunicatimonas pelagia]